MEIKSGQTLSPDLLAGQPLDTSTLVYGGSEASTRNGVAVRPCSSSPPISGRTR